MKKQKEKHTHEEIDIVNLAINELHFIKSENDPKSNKSTHKEIWLKSDRSIDHLVVKAKEMLK